MATIGDKKKKFITSISLYSVGSLYFIELSSPCGNKVAAMFSGYLTKRDSPQSPPSMQKVFCVLWGIILMDYDNEDDAKTLMNPKLVVELVGVSEWDGKGRANYYPAGLLLVTRTRGNYYASCSSVHERDEWILHFKRSLECAFANNEIAPFKPSHFFQSRINTDVRNGKCPRTDYQVNAYSPKCNSCGRRFYSAEHVSDYCVLTQLGSEEAEKVCADCKNSQMCIFWLKTMNNVQFMDLHELTDSVLTNVKKFHASFQLRRRISQRLDMAGELYSNGSLDTEEFEELRSVDHAYRREVQHDECLKLKHAVEAFGEDLQTVLNVLMNDAMTSKGGRNAYFTLILRVLELADQAPDLVDFYFPQLYQIHLQQLLVRTPEAYIKVDCLQQALLVLAQKYPSFGLKLSWNLMATIGDYQEKRATQVQYAACMALLLQLEMVMTGQISCIADVPTSKVLHQLLRPAAHQQQEIGIEIGALFIIRRKLQEAYDAEEEARKERNRQIYGECNPDLAEEKEAALKKMKPLPLYPGTNHSCSCIELLYHLGVGQAPSKTRQMTHRASNRNLGEDAPSDGSDSHLNNMNSNNGVFYWDGFDRQIDFLGRINALVDHLRFVDRPLRAETLKKQLHKWNNYHGHRSGENKQKRSKSTASVTSTVDDTSTVGSNISMDAGGNISNSLLSLPSIDDLSAMRHSRGGSQEDEQFMDHNPKLGWDPTTIAGEPHYRITRIIVDECRVFRTKARAPTMIVCEVMRDDVYRQMYSRTSDTTENISESDSALAPSEGMSGLFIETADEATEAQVKQKSGYLITPTAATAVVSRERGSSMSITKMPRSNTLSNSNIHSSPSTDNSSHNNNGGTSCSDPQKSFQDVDSLIVSSLNPVIAEMQLHRQQQQQQDEQELQQQNTQQTRLVANAQAFPRRKSGGILPTNRLSSSTEGILRSSSHINLASSGNVVNSNASSPKSTPHPSGIFLPEAGINNAASEALADNSPSTSEVGADSSPGPGALPGSNNLEHIIVSAQKLLIDGTITEKEYQQLIVSDLNYREEIARETALIEKSRVENVLGESFQSKKERILGNKLSQFNTSNTSSKSNTSYKLNRNSANHNNNNAFHSISTASAAVPGTSSDSPDDSMLETHPNDFFWPSVDLRSFIVKTNDDLRQEICCMQLMQIFKEIFDHFSLNHMLFLKPYRIICTGSTSGVIEVLQDAVSLDALKRTAGFTTLANHFKTVYDTSPQRLQQAKHNFMASLAAYSLFSYLLMVKDRHNGNLLIDSEGHIIHIDFVSCCRLHQADPFPSKPPHLSLQRKW
jgi:hypothetical protein